MSELTKALKQIKNWIEINTSLNNKFNPGLTSAKIEILLKNVPFKLPREVRELYEFFDGGVGVSLFPFWGFYSLEKAIKEYHYWAEVYREDCELLYQLPLVWLAGEYYVICKEEEIDIKKRDLKVNYITSWIVFLIHDELLDYWVSVLELPYKLILPCLYFFFD